MVSNSRAAHFHHGGNINHALFTVTENPENTDSCSVAKLFKDIRDNLKIFCGWHIFHKLVLGLAMLMGQSKMFHTNSSYNVVILHHKAINYKSCKKAYFMVFCN